MVPGCSGLTPDPTFDLNSPPNPTSPSGNVYFGGNTEDTISIGHRVRNGESFDQGAEETGEIFDLVVVGAGLALHRQVVSAGAGDPERNLEVSKPRSR
jgi:hypothetical protein